jgi:hypothetical protein
MEQKDVEFVSAVWLESPHSFVDPVLNKSMVSVNEYADWSKKNPKFLTPQFEDLRESVLKLNPGMIKGKLHQPFDGPSRNLNPTLHLHSVLSKTPRIWALPYPVGTDEHGNGAHHKIQIYVGQVYGFDHESEFQCLSGRFHKVAEMFNRMMDESYTGYRGMGHEDLHFQIDDEQYSICRATLHVFSNSAGAVLEYAYLLAELFNIAGLDVLRIRTGAFLNEITGVRDVDIRRIDMTCKYEVNEGAGVSKSFFEAKRLVNEARKESGVLNVHMYVVNDWDTELTFPFFRKDHFDDSNKKIFKVLQNSKMVKFKNFNAVWVWHDSNPASTDFGGSYEERNFKDVNPLWEKNCVYREPRNEKLIVKNHFPLNRLFYYDAVELLASGQKED